MCQPEEEEGDEDGIFSPVRIPGEEDTALTDSCSLVDKSPHFDLIDLRPDPDSGPHLLVFTGSCCARVKWVITWPLGLLLYCTVPNCVLPRWHRWFMVTFVASTLWIAVFSYLMVWMVSSALLTGSQSP